MNQTAFKRACEASKRFAWVIAVIAIAGCNDGGSSPTGTAGAAGAAQSSLSTLSIAGTPSAQATANQLYSFNPSVSAPAGSDVSFSIQNKPSWATFSTVNGSLSGTPSAADVGTDGNIVITASNARITASLAVFAILVRGPLSKPIMPASSSSSATGSTATTTSGGSGTTLVFNYSNGFASAGSAAGDTLYSIFDPTVANGLVEMTLGNATHQARNIWYPSQLDISSFTTEFTFQNQQAGGVPAYGMSFIIAPPTNVNANGGGLYNAGDANGLGYFCYAACPNNANSQERFYQSVAIVFDTSKENGANYIGPSAASASLYLNGGPGIDNGAIPQNSLNPTGVNMYLGDIMDAYLTYDGQVLSMVLTDTSTGAKARYAWPVDIRGVCQCATAYVGMGAGNIGPVTSPYTGQNFNSWVWYSGVNSQLATPTFSIASGQYSGTQVVSVACPSGATCYYTTNGQEPTTASLHYSSAITVTSTEVVKVIAIENGYRDSAVATGYYQICSGCTYPIDFSGGFSNYSGLLNLVGMSFLSQSAIHLVDKPGGTVQRGVGAVWNIAPVNVSSFATTFTLRYLNAAGAPQAGTVFTIQNLLPASEDTSAPQVPASGCDASPCGSSVTGGPLTLGGSNGTGPAYMGWYGIGESVGVKFDLSNNSTAILTDGESTGDRSTPLTGGLSLASGDPIQVRLTYDGTTLSETLTDTTTGQSFTTAFQVNIPSVVGASSAYVGFVGAEGYDYDAQEITAWTLN